MWVRWGPVGSSGDRLCQTSPIPRSPDGDKNDNYEVCRKSAPESFQIFEEWKGISNSARQTWDPGNSWT